MRLLILLKAIMLPGVLAATTIIAVRHSSFVVITADSKATYLGKPGDPRVCKIMLTGQTYFAISGLDHDKLRGVFFQQIVADSLVDTDAFPIKVEKVEKAVQAAVLKEMTAVQIQDQDTYYWLMRESNVTSILLAEFRDSTPHLCSCLQIRTR